MKTSTSLSLLAILLQCMFLCSHMFVVAGLCREDQRSLLLQLKNNFTFKYGYEVRSGKLGSWNQSIACCQWSGVTCDEEGHVAGLDLSGESISGGFDNSSSLFSLQHLQILNLADNYFRSEIPSRFNKLENLTYLNLSYARFWGQIPIEISRLARLVTLDISSYHYVTGPALKLENPNLGKLVQNLTKIRQLYLNGVDIPAGGQKWYAALLQIPTLQELSMSYCNLRFLDSSLARLENLSVIRLDLNNFSSPLPETFANFKILTTLSLFDCGLTGIFPQKIFQVPTLSFIDISDNYDLHGSFPDFPINGSLQTLLVSSTVFSGPLPNSIGNLRQLSRLDLSYSKFNGTLPNSLSNLTQLVELDLSVNRFAGPIPSLDGCKKLQSVDLSVNYFSGKIPSSIFMLPSLRIALFSRNEFDGQLNDFRNVSSVIQVLDLTRNHLEGPIPISVFQLKDLQYLDLSFNNFSGKIELNMISKLPKLTTLDLSNNSLSIIDATTTVSPFLSFPNLAFVSLASCKMTTFPQFPKNQSGLIHLDLSNSLIVGTVPHWIRKHNSLKLLNLSHNYLTGWEEPQLSNMSSLVVLDLHSNYLRGPLPILPPRVFYLDYSGNNLSSIIPPNIDNYLFSNVFLSLSSNNLHGNIPESICNAPLLHALDLSNNALTGKIPKCLIAMKGMSGGLVILDLRRNKLSGTMDTFSGSCDLKTLHLNGNSLYGKLPKYLVDCTMLEVLDLGDNQIHEEFPCWLKNISTLRVLILRSNKFYGSLECRGTQVAWPHLQIVDLASNNFGGKIPVPFFETWEAMMADQNDGSLSKHDHLQFPIQTYGHNYYQERVTFTSKTKTMDLVKILNILTAIDLSCNKFEGLIPEGLGQLHALHMLNLSHNAFSGHIPSSFGNMRDLESLDLSNNNLSGKIPTQLASLSFLSFLNLSYNHLVGRIPIGGQFPTFGATSFKGNPGLCGGLCGPPLTHNCSGDGVQPAPKDRSINWNYISAELGFTLGIGIVVLPLVLYKPWRIWYWERVDNLLYHIFPQLDFVYEGHGKQRYRSLRWKTY